MYNFIISVLKSRILKILGYLLSTSTQTPCQLMFFIRKEEGNKEYHSENGKKEKKRGRRFF